MNKFTFTGKYLKLVVLGLGLSFQYGSVNAALINNNFDDLGTSTVDLVNNLEWLDVTTTRGLTVNEVRFDLNNTGGLFDPNDGWRYASRSDFQNLITDWFSIDYSGGRYSFGENDSNLVDLFIGAFGDTVDENYDATNYTLDARANEFGMTRGVLGDDAGRNGTFQRAVEIADNDFIFRASGNSFSNQSDYLTDISSTGISQARNDMGHFLIRDFNSAPPSVSVAEPSPFALLSLGLIGLMLKRRKS